MPEHVVDADLGVRWEPNAPDAVLLAGDGGRVVLAVRAHPDDVDDRSVVLCWSGVVWSCSGVPNDEALRFHRLYGKGLETVLWVGRVEQSELVRSLAAMVHDTSALRHDVLTLKEGIVEVIARSVTTCRVGGTTRRAARTYLA
ncbi:hypothetical protein [Luteimicrobium subarcticum]|uniref:Uncharacterized protein n=1 Tax=Luteimicrobium subarcticum TaxID=620910 RepID=A0A2M8WJ59_9MICO|nr:hypothetical protein [Luteimicrobium subarcticum]PJI90943.1 hypothetical protein CLV34_2201 [Luteimicrobium subarcticum]